MFKQSICHGSGLKGHKRKVCRSTRQPSKSHKQYQQSKVGHWVDLDQEEEHWIDVDQRRETVDNEIGVFTIGRTSTTNSNVSQIVYRYNAIGNGS